MFTFTPDAVEKIPTKPLTDVAAAFEALSALARDVPDCEAFVISLEGGLDAALHVIDAELQRRPVL